MLESVAAVQEKIAAGKNLLLGGDESLLRQLPPGNWIGGTIAYFMDADGGVQSQAKIFVTELPDYARIAAIRRYNREDLSSICEDAPENGFSFLIMPAASPVHLAYAQDFPKYSGAFVKPVVGWISGVKLDELGRRHPKVFHGPSGAHSETDAVVMHVALPTSKLAEIEIVNVFQQGSGDPILFAKSGYATSECQVNRKPCNLARYIQEKQVDWRLPLTANYGGSIVNVSVQSVDLERRQVRLYAPVFAGVEYRFARPVPDYIAAFKSALPVNGPRSVFSCNCILNYLYAKLEGKKTGNEFGPMTFGEIAHQVVNQTMVRLLVLDIDER